MKIIVNGREHSVDNPVSYETIVELAELKQRSDYSMTYCGRRKSDSQRAGILHAGQTVEATEGMAFNVALTGAS